MLSFVSISPVCFVIFCVLPTSSFSLLLCSLTPRIPLPPSLSPSLSLCVWRHPFFPWFRWAQQETQQAANETPEAAAADREEQQHRQQQQGRGGVGGKALPPSSGGGGANSNKDGTGQGGDGEAAAAAAEAQHRVLEVNSRSVEGSLDEASFEELGGRTSGSAEEVSVLGDASSVWGGKGKGGGGERCAHVIHDRTFKA